MAIRVLMVDVDGVVIRRPDGRRWDHSIELDLGIAPAALQQHFFAPYWKDILVGRAPITERLADALPRFAPHVTPEQLMEYWFARDTGFDQTLLDDLAMLRAGGIGVHLATDQEHRRAAYLWATLGLQDRFDTMHYAADLGARKIEPAFCAEVTRRTGFAPHEIGFIDDSAGNITAAQAAGWRGYVWTPESRLAEALAAIGHP